MLFLEVVIKKSSMCRIVDEDELLIKKVNEMEKNGGNNNGMVVLSHAKMILWMTRGMTTLLLWICVV